MVFLVLLAGLIVFLAFRLFWGYPKPAREFQILARRDVAFLDAAADVFFPAGEGMPLSGKEADLPGYADDYLAQLPVSKRRLILALLSLFEQGPLLWPARGVGAFRRFSSLDPEQRVRVMQGWADSRLFLRRMAFSALKAVLILGYLGRSESLESLGFSPWSFESPVCEADLLYPPIGASRQQIAFTRDDLTEPSAGIPLRENQKERL